MLISNQSRYSMGKIEARLSKEICHFHSYFLRKCQMKKKIFVLLSSWVRRLIGKAGLRSSSHVGNIRDIKNFWYVVDPHQKLIRFLP